MARAGSVSFACAAGLLGLVPMQAPATTWQPPAGLRQMPIWPGNAPDEARDSRIPETTQIKAKSIAGRPTTMVHDVVVPTITFVPPKGHNTGAAIVVFPGGGFNVLAIDLEGTEVCDWITAHGMTCALLKYRVPHTDDYGDPGCHCQVVPAVPRALQDAQRAIRITRSKAKDLGIDANRIGVIGFSAGGFLVAQTSTIVAPTYKPVDAVDAISSRPDFAVAAYPGHVCKDDGTLNATIHVTRQTPPTFIVQNWDDQTDDICNSTLYAQALAAAGVPAEVHLFAKGDHAFALRDVGHPVTMWPSLLERWLKDIAIL